MGKWLVVPSEASYCVAVCEFKAPSEGCLSLELGDRLFLYEECDGWYLGYKPTDPDNPGLFPKAYVRIKPATGVKVGSRVTVNPAEEPIIEEAKNVLREWHEQWKDLFSAPYSAKYSYKNNLDLFQSIKGIMCDIITALSSSYLGVLGQNQLEEKKIKITQSIDHGNMLLGLDMVPRDDLGNIVSPICSSDDLARSKNGVSVMELYNIHKRVNTYRAHKGSETVRPNEPVHIFFGISQCVMSNPVPLELYATLYNYKENRMISERFLAPLTKNGLPEDKDRLNDIRTVFTDICRDDLPNLFIIVRFYRKGPVKWESGGGSASRVPASGATTYLRPLGLSYFSIKTHMDALEANVGVRTEATSNRLDIYSLGRDKSEREFCDLHSKVIMGERAQFQQFDNIQGLYISDVKILFGTLEQVKQQNPHLFKRPAASVYYELITRKLGFPAVINPTDQRNDLYITLKRANFKKGNKTADRNVLVSVSVRDQKGNEVQGAISRGTGEPHVNQYHSSVIYHSNAPHWDETFRVNLPDIGSYSFENCHLLFTFRHANDKAKNRDRPGFSFIPLANMDGTLIANKLHKLIVYKDTEKSASFRHQTSDYLSLPYYFDSVDISKDTKIAGKTFEQKFSEFIEINTVFCSLKFTQNSDLKSLLQWEQHPARLGEILQRVTLIQGEELVKFLHPIFEALFTILDKRNSEFGEIVFDCIVFIICTLADNKFEQFRPVLDNYIDRYFFHTQVYIKLLDRLVAKVEQYRDSTSNNIGIVMKALEYLFKFIVQSSRLHSQTQTIDRSFKKIEDSLLQFFKKLNDMIGVNPSRLNVAKALKYFPSTIPELSKILPLERTCMIITDFVDAVPVTDEKEIINYKLACINEIVRGDVIEDEVGCSLLTPLLMRHLKMHLRTEDTKRDDNSIMREKNLAVEILTHILITVSKKHSKTPIVGQIVSPLLELLFSLVCQADKSSELARDFVSCLIALLHLMNDEHYNNYMREMDEPDLVNFLNDVFSVFKDLVEHNVYPSMWIVMSMLQSYVILTSITFFSRALTNISPLANGPQGQDYMGKKKQLWYSFFQLCVGFITQRSLQLEEFRESKRNKIAKQYGDMRSEMGQEMVRMFNTLEKNKKIFIPEIIESFIKVSLVPLESLRKDVIPIFYDVIECYYLEKGNFELVEREIIDKLDKLISGGKGDLSYSTMIHKILYYKFDSYKGRMDPLRQTGIRFVVSVKYLLTHLLNFREVGAGDNNSEARMLCIVNLLNFYDELNRSEMYLRYIWKLYVSHIAQKNFVQAAFTLDLYASKLRFEDMSYIQPFEGLPGERVAERKARLILMIIRHFEEGKSYENTFRFYKDLCDYYEKMFDYQSLASALNKQAGAYSAILSTTRYPQAYYYVGFHGRGFPQFLQNKQFIYAGREHALSSHIATRFQEQFPKASMLSYTSTPPPETRDSPEQYLQIYKVTSVIEERGEFAGKEVPTAITQFYDTNDITCFSYDRRFNKLGGKIKDDDFENTWLERTKFSTGRERLPNKLRLVEIVETEVTEMSPIKTANEQMANKNKELRVLIDSYKQNKDKNANALTGFLNGAVNAVVMGGTKVYEDAFLHDAYLAKNPDDRDDVIYLKGLMVEFVDILEDGIEVHDKIISEDVRPLHDHIVKTHRTMREDTNCYRRELGISSGKPFRTGTLSVRSTTNSATSLSRYNSTLSRNQRSRSSMISVNSGGEDPSMVHPPPLPSRRAEVLPDPASLVRERRSISQAPPPDQPALPPKKRTSMVSSQSPNMGTSNRSMNSNGSLDLSYSNNSINDNEVRAPGLPPRPTMTPPDNNNSILVDDGRPPLPVRTNSTPNRPPKAPRDKTVPLPNF